MNKYILSILFSALFTSLSAQTLTNSPYSRFGVGDLMNANSVRNQSMGGIRFGSSHSYTINTGNPASYRRLAYSTLDLSGFSEFLDLRTKTAENKLHTAGINQFVFAFPTNFRTSFVIGLSPYSAVGYRFQNQYSAQLDTQSVEYLVAYSASGGLNNFFGGAAFSLFKGLDIGVNAGFIFGNTNYAWNLTFIENTSLNPVSYQRKMYQQGFNLTAGAQYTDTISLKENRKIVLKGGLVYDQGARLASEQVLISRNLNPLKVTPDTLSGLQTSTVQVPRRIGFGVEMERYLIPGSPLSQESYWSVGADVSVQDWSDYAAFGQNAGLAQSYRIAAGGEWVPRLVSKIYFLKMAYRIGGNYEKTNLELNGEAIRQAGITFGFGLPFARTASKIHLGAEIGRRGTTSNNLISENYYRIRLGLSLNERWFMRYRVD